MDSRPRGRDDGDGAGVRRVECRSALVGNRSSGATTGPEHCTSPPVRLRGVRSAGKAPLSTDPGFACCLIRRDHAYRKNPTCENGETRAMRDHCARRARSSRIGRAPFARVPADQRSASPVRTVAPAPSNRPTSEDRDDDRPKPDGALATKPMTPLLPIGKRWRFPSRLSGQAGPSEPIARGGPSRNSWRTASRVS